MTVLVTGGAGLIGMAVRALLRARGVPVLATDITAHGRDDPTLHLASLEETARLARNAELRAIVHCGAISGPMMARGRPNEIVAANIDGTAAMLDLARTLAVRRFVFCSSISVYGDAGTAALTEARAPCLGSVYAASKVAGEALTEAYAAEYGVDGVSLRIGRVYGPYRRAHCVLKAMIEDARAGRVTRIPCAPDFLYHYVWVGDVATAIAACLDAPALPARLYNIGSGEALTMPAIVAIARAALLGLHVEMVDGADDVPDRQTVFPVDRIAADLGWHPRFDLARGIAAYAAALPETRTIT
jgi:UDP-glucuronate 4-epimerase